MKATIKTDNPELRKEFLSTLMDSYSNRPQTRSGQLLASVSEMRQEGNEYIFEVEYV